MDIVNLKHKALFAKSLGASNVEIIGKWVWAAFDSKPSQDIRDRLKSEFFRWNPKRFVWQFAGCPSRHTSANKEWVAFKYGSIKIDEVMQNV